jgi:hypothetical protein
MQGIYFVLEKPRIGAAWNEFDWNGWPTDPKELQGISVKSFLMKCLDTPPPFMK